MDEYMYTKQIEEYYNVDQVDIEQYQFEEEYKMFDRQRYQYMLQREIDRRFLSVSIWL